MSIVNIAFYVFASITVIAAAMVVTMKNPVKCALSLVLAFFSAACVWITLQAEFLAIVLVLVYVGAVMVLFLFVVMMLNIDIAEMRAGFTQYLPIGAIIAVLLAVELALVMVYSFGLDKIGPLEAVSREVSNSKALGQSLYTTYIYPFEIASLILLVAIIAAISLTMRRRPDSKFIDPGEQVLVTREDRLKIVKMAPVVRNEETPDTDSSANKEGQ